MRKCIYLMTLGILAMPIGAWAEILTPSDLAGLPQRTKHILRRYDACLHFAGEWSGEPSLDQYVRQRTQELDCEHIERDINALRRKAGAHSRTRQLIEKIEYGYGACQNETTTPLLKG